MKVNKKKFGENGAMLYQIENDNGLILEATDFGARIVKLWVPDKQGELKNIVLGFDSAEEYLEKDTYFGATIGRVAGRIHNGQFSISGVDHELPLKNEKGNVLHGGPHSFEEKVWKTDIQEGKEEIKLLFKYISPEGENGFPGELTATTIYTFNNDNEWTIDFIAATSKDTLYNPTNHVYFNLNGDFTQSVANHEFWLAADRYAVLDEDSIPTGELRAVEQTPFDFQGAEKSVDQGFKSNDPQNKMVDGFDHPFVLVRPSLDKPQAILKTEDMRLVLYTNDPSVVVYTTNIGEKTIDMQGKTVKKHAGITLETQILPDAIHHQGFGNIILKKEDIFHSKTIYKVN